MADRYAEDRIFLQRIQESMIKTRDELETRLEELDDQILYLEHSMLALEVYEHVSPPTPNSPVSPSTKEVQ